MQRRRATGYVIGAMVIAAGWGMASGPASAEPSGYEKLKNMLSNMKTMIGWILKDAEKVPAALVLDRAAFKKFSALTEPYISELAVYSATVKKQRQIWEAEGAGQLAGKAAKNGLDAAKAKSGKVEGKSKKKPKAPKKSPNKPKKKPKKKAPPQAD